MIVGMSFDLFGSLDLAAAIGGVVVNGSAAPSIKIKAASGH
jgi:hypothetical protein